MNETNKEIEECLLRIEAILNTLREELDSSRECLVVAVHDNK